MAEVLGDVRVRRPRKLRLYSADGLQPLGHAGLCERVADSLRVLITRCELSPGVRVVEADLCRLLGVSRTPLREALRLLAAEGLLELRPNRSARIKPMDPVEIGELFETVSGIERIAAELAAARLTPREFKRLAATQARMERLHEAGDRSAYFSLNQQIHSLVVAGAKNAVLKDTHGRLLARVERARYFALGMQGRWDESVAEHREVLAALELRDAVRAGNLLARHVRRTGEVVAALLQSSLDHSHDGEPAMPDAPDPVNEIEAVLSTLLDATGGSRGTLRADDAARGWQSDVPCAEVLRHGAPSMRHDGSVNHRAAETIQWLARTRSILKQEDLRGVAPRPPQALTEIYLAKAQMIGPIFRGDHLYGWVSVHDVQGPRPWSRDDEQAMTAAVHRISDLLGQKDC